MTFLSQSLGRKVDTICSLIRFQSHFYYIRSSRERYENIHLLEPDIDPRGRDFRYGMKSILEEEGLNLECPQRMERADLGGMRPKFNQSRVPHSKWGCA